MQTIDVLRTCADWYVMQKACKKALMQVCTKGVPRLPIEDGVLAYSTSWTSRGVLLLKMHIAKVSPDKTKNLHRVFLAGNNNGLQKYKTIGDLMQDAGRVRRPELLSMDCCFAGDPALDLVDVTDENLDISPLRAARIRLTKRYKTTPHIAEVIREVMRDS